MAGNDEPSKSVFENMRQAFADPQRKPVAERGSSERWQPAFSDLVAIGTIIAAGIMWYQQPTWQIGIPFSVFVIALVVFAAKRHQSHPFWRILVALCVIGFYIWAASWPTWQSFRSDYPNAALQWPITFNPTDGADLTDYSLAPIQSRMDRFIFACNMQQPKSMAEDADNRDQLRKNVQGWADTIGVAVSFSKITDGIQVTVEAKTDDAKAWFASMGLLPGVTKVFLQSRWLVGRQIIVAFAKVPKNYPLKLSAMVPDPTDPRIGYAEDQIAQIIGAGKGACSLI